MMKAKAMSTQGLGKSMLLGSAAGMCVITVGCMIAATLLNNEKIMESGMGYAVMGMLILASYSGGYTACKIMKGQRLASSLLTGI